MRFLLDTSICIYIINNKSANVLNHFTKLSPGDVLLSSITLAELQYGVEKSQHKSRNREALIEFILPLEVVSFDEHAADKYGALRTYLERKGTPIGALDLMIASHALSLEVTLVTNNVKEFKRVPKLLMVDWTKDF